MRPPIFVTAAFIGLVLLMPFSPSVAAAGSGMNSGLNSTSMMVVQRERQEKIRKCARLPGFDSNSMTYAGQNGRRVKCP